MATSIIFGPSVIEWVGSKLDHQFEGELLGLGLKRDDRFVAGVVYHDRKFHDVHASVVATPGGFTRKYLRAIFHYPFNQLGVNRITVTIKKSNEKSIRLAIRLGFTLEGLIRKGFHDGEDMLIFGLLREECVWLS